MQEKITREWKERYGHSLITKTWCGKRKQTAGNLRCGQVCVSLVTVEIESSRDTNPHTQAHIKCNELSGFFSQESKTSRESRFVCERVYLSFLLPHWSNYEAHSYKELKKHRNITSACIGGRVGLKPIYALSTGQPKYPLYFHWHNVETNEPLMPRLNIIVKCLKLNSEFNFQ